MLAECFLLFNGMFDTNPVQKVRYFWNYLKQLLHHLFFFITLIYQQHHSYQTRYETHGPVIARVSETKG